MVEENQIVAIKYNHLQYTRGCTEIANALNNMIYSPEKYADLHKTILMEGAFSKECEALRIDAILMLTWLPFIKSILFHYNNYIDIEFLNGRKLNYYLHHEVYYQLLVAFETK